MIEKISKNSGGISEELRNGMFEKIDWPEINRGSFALIFGNHKNGEDRVAELILNMKKYLDSSESGREIKEELRRECTEIDIKDDFADKAYKILFPLIKPVSERVSDESK